MDSNGLLLAVVVTIAAIEDRDGAFRLLAALRAHCSTITLVWAVGGYAGRLIGSSKGALSLTVQVVKRVDEHQRIPGSSAQVGGRENVRVDF